MKDVTDPYAPCGSIDKVVRRRVERLGQIFNELFAVCGTAFRRAFEYDAEHELLEGVARFGRWKNNRLVVRVVVVDQLARDIRVGSARTRLILRGRDQRFKGLGEEERSTA